MSNMLYVKTAKGGTTFFFNEWAMAGPSYEYIVKYDEESFISLYDIILGENLEWVEQ